MAIPEEIRKMRPTWLGKATEVRFIGGHYYVYEISSSAYGVRNGTGVR